MTDQKKNFSTNSRPKKSLKAPILKVYQYTCWELMLTETFYRQTLSADETFKTVKFPIQKTVSTAVL